MTLPQQGDQQIANRDTDFANFIQPTRTNQDLGSEIEVFLVDANLKPINYETHQVVLRHFARDNPNIKMGYEQGLLTHLIGQNADKGSVICGEPGCQIEWARRPVADLNQAAAETDAFFRDLIESAAAYDLAVSIPGLYPLARGAQIPLSGRPRYQAFQNRINAVPGGFGPDISRGTCALQTNIDTRRDTWKMTVQTAMGIQPVVTALFANSPVFDGELTRDVSTRAKIWFECWGTDTKAYRQLIMAADFSAEKFVAFISAQPLPLLGDIELPADTTFNDLLDPATRPACLQASITIGDFNHVLGTTFAPIKIKKGGVIELRGADASFELRHSLEALACGLFYDDANLARVHERVMSWSLGDQEEMAHVAPRQGLDGRFGRKSVTLRDVAAELCGLAYEGLRRRGLNEANLLDPVARIAFGDAKSPAEQTRAAIIQGASARDVFARSLLRPEHLAITPSSSGWINPSPYP